MVECCKLQDWWVGRVLVDSIGGLDRRHWAVRGKLAGVIEAVECCKLQDWRVWRVLVGGCSVLDMVGCKAHKYNRC